MDTKRLRQKILDLAIRGKLVPQDPNDEPASFLLERIRAEKERLIKEGKIKRNRKPVYRTSESEVPFEIPENWKWCKLDDLAIYKKGPFGSSLTKSMFVPDTPNAYKVYEQKNAINKDATLGHYFIDREKYEELKGFAVLPSDIIVSCAGTIGETYILPQGTREGIINQALMLIRLFDTTITYFYLLYFDYILKKEAAKESKGTAIKNIPPFEVLKNFQIPIPPLAEQKRIAHATERWFSLIDILENEKSDLQASIQQAKSKILDLAIHGKLVPQDPNDEPAIELLKRINAKFEACEDSLYKYIPQGWAVCAIQDIASSELGKTLDREKNKGEFRPYLCSINVFWNQFDLSEMKQMRFEDGELEHYSIHRGDLVICEGGDAGRCAVWPYNNSVLFQNAIHRVRFKANIDSHFYMYLLMYLKNNHLLDKYCKGVTIKHFTKTALISLPVVLPPINEQLRIVAKIEELFAILDNIKESLA